MVPTSPYGLNAIVPGTQPQAAICLQFPQPHVVLSHQQNWPAGALNYTQSSFLGLVCNLLTPLCPVLDLVGSRIPFKTARPFPVPGSLSGSSWQSSVLATTSRHGSISCPNLSSRSGNDSYSHITAPDIQNPEQEKSGRRRVLCRNSSSHPSTGPHGLSPQGGQPFRGKGFWPSHHQQLRPFTRQPADVAGEGAGTWLTLYLKATSDPSLGQQEHQ